MTARALFIGRFSPFHRGHLSMMEKKIKEGKPLLIFVRDTYYDIYPAELRKRMIEACMSKLKVDAKVMLIGDIESINYGRGVGYEVNEIEVRDDIKTISASEIRAKIDEGDNSWRKLMASGADEVLEKYLANKGVVVWLSGLPCSGKTTIANVASDALRERGTRTERLDGDILRKHVTQDLGFTKEDRRKNLRRASFIAKLLARNGVVVLSSFITPYESVRKEIRKDLEEDAHFVEVYVRASLEACKKRDTKGLYKKAEKGEIKNFTGVSDPYEEPKNPDLILDTEKKSVEECKKELVNYIESLI